MAGVKKQANPAKGAAKERKAKHTYGEEDVMLIKDCVDDCMGHRPIFNKSTKDRKNGIEDWSIGGAKKSSE